MLTKDWVSTRHLQHFIAHAENSGLNLDELLFAANLTKSVLDDADGTIPLSALETMLFSISKRYSDPLMGLHIASDIQPATFGAIGFISQVCATFGDVLDVISRYNGLLSSIGRASIVHQPGAVHISWECLAGGEILQRQAVEYVLGSCAVLARLLVPESKDLLQAVNFSHTRLEDVSHMREYFDFFQCPVYFDQPVSSLVFPAELLKAKLRHSDAAMKERLEQHVNHLFRQRESHRSIVDDVKRLIRGMMVNGTPNKDKIAQQLGSSGRSLHRNLHELNTSYQELLDQVRLDVAHGLLIDHANSIQLISENIGFSTHQAFIRWFKKNTGQTPTEYRHQEKGA